ASWGGGEAHGDAGGRRPARVRSRSRREVQAHQPGAIASTEPRPGNELDEEAGITEAEQSASDPIPANYRRIEVDVAELKQLFNTMDPFRYSSPTSSQRIAASPGVALGLHGSLIGLDI